MESELQRLKNLTEISNQTSDLVIASYLSLSLNAEKNNSFSDTSDFASTTITFSLITKFLSSTANPFSKSFEFLAEKVLHQMAFQYFVNRLVTSFNILYPHLCKNIFVHFSEKTNLLFRSENNTGIFTGKFLQTTTL